MMTRGVVIFCHGSGDTAAGAQAWVQSVGVRSALAQFDWDYPGARPIPYTLNRGAVSSVWYDRVGGFEPSYPEHTETIEASVSALTRAIEGHIARGVPAARIALGGFSMGGAMAVQTAARWHADSTREPLGAVFCLSSYLSDNSAAFAMTEASGALWPQVHFSHGADDDFILPAWGERTAERLRAAGVDATFKTHAKCRHELVPSSIADLLAFLLTKFPAACQ